MNCQKKFGYLKGLTEGLSVGPQTNEGRVLLAVIDLLEGITDTLADMEQTHRDIRHELEDVTKDVSLLDEAVENFDEQLVELYGGLRQIFSGDQDSEDDDDDDDEDDDQADETYYEVSCPHCGKKFTLGESQLDQGFVLCPKCKGRLEFDHDHEGCPCGGEH
ncbi:MAG: zinc-ribbon domain-containing protein [Oscillospiraceae bacterium]|jgi:hypothetical protein|nr:zinc-ribbon domain-containing protein [Oscillospiraceae bacterium]